MQQPADGTWSRWKVSGPFPKQNAHRSQKSSMRIARQYMGTAGAMRGRQAARETLQISADGRWVGECWCFIRQTSGGNDGGRASARTRALRSARELLLPTLLRAVSVPRVCTDGRSVHCFTGTLQWLAVQPRCGCVLLFCRSAVAGHSMQATPVVPYSKLRA